MRRQIDTDRLVESWLAEGPSRLPHHVVDGIVRQLDTTHQRKRWTLPRWVTTNRLLLAGGAVAAAVVIAVVGFFYLSGRTDPNVGGPSTPTPTPTPTPGRLAYGLDGDIYLADWDGQNPIRIADGVPRVDDVASPSCNEFWAVGLMWSPDGRHFAYRSNSDDRCSSSVFIADAAGQLVASFPGTGWDIAWSPDSTRVATWVEEGRTIGIYGLDGERHVLLTLPPDLLPPCDCDPRWSPDGGSVLMRLAPPMPSPVWELPVDGGAPVRLPAEDPRSHWDIGYSPDGAQVAYMDGNSVVVTGADGAEDLVLASAYYPLWSPRGDQVVFSWTDDPHEESSGPYAHDLRIADVATGNVTTLASFRLADEVVSAIAFSPEGGRILFRSAEELWSVNADGTEARLLVAGTSWGDWQ